MTELSTKRFEELGHDLERDAAMVSRTRDKMDEIKWRMEAEALRHEVCLIALAEPELTHDTGFDHTWSVTIGRCYGRLTEALADDLCTEAFRLAKLMHVEVCMISEPRNKRSKGMKSIRLSVIHSDAARYSV